MSFQHNENQTNLIINYLPQLYSDDELFNLFSSVGKVNNCKIIRDKSTGYSYGFGFVDFTTPEEAQNAIATLNGYELDNKTIKVALARPPGEQTKGANLYVRNIPQHYDEEQLKQMFSQYGCIVQARILVDHSTGQSKGSGFVLFEQKTDAERALNEMDQYTPPDGNRPLGIKFADDNSKKVRAPVQMQGGYGGYGGGGYGPRTGGPMRGPGGSRMRYNPMGVSGSGAQGNGYGSYGGGGYQSGYGGGAPRGRGMSMGNPIRGQGYNQQQFGGGDGPDPNDVILFVYNIGNDATEHDIWGLFSPYGTIKKVNVIWDHAKNQCKGYGFVTMSSTEEAKFAIDYLNGFYYKTAPLQVSIKSDKQ